mmetsp:Transcript_54389/g.140513  ORF Transcript_54389/g.140513 Transcript_54389/m.140513 type:complete len:202 (+) Transcript_54389:281-886(+)
MVDVFALARRTLVGVAVWCGNSGALTLDDVRTVRSSAHRTSQDRSAADTAGWPASWCVARARRHRQRPWCRYDADTCDVRRRAWRCFVARHTLHAGVLSAFGVCRRRAVQPRLPAAPRAPGADRVACGLSAQVEAVNRCNGRAAPAGLWCQPAEQRRSGGRQRWLHGGPALPICHGAHHGYCGGVRRRRELVRTAYQLTMH